MNKSSTKIIAKEVLYLFIILFISITYLVVVFFYNIYVHNFQLEPIKEERLVINDEIDSIQDSVNFDIENKPYTEKVFIYLLQHTNRFEDYSSDELFSYSNQFNGLSERAYKGSIDFYEHIFNEKYQNDLYYSLKNDKILSIPISEFKNRILSSKDQSLGYHKQRLKIYELESRANDLGWDYENNNSIDWNDLPSHLTYIIITFFILFPLRYLINLFQWTIKTLRTS